MRKLTLEEWGILSVLYLEEFVKITLALPFKLYMKYDYWSHNRAVAKAARDAELNPPTLPDHADIEIPQDPS